MFLGEYPLVINNKGRLRLPRPFSPFLAAGLVITRGFEQNLMIFPQRNWQAVAGEVLEQSIFLSQSRVLRRRLFSQAAELMPDRRGTIALPDGLLAFAGIGETAVAAGMFDYVEIWQPDRWRELNEGVFQEISPRSENSAQR